MILNYTNNNYININTIIVIPSYIGTDTIVVIILPTLLLRVMGPHINRGKVT
jgi:hypothetical protein